MERLTLGEFIARYYPVEGGVDASALQSASHEAERLTKAEAARNPGRFGWIGHRVRYAIERRSEILEGRI